MERLDALRARMDDVDDRLLAVLVERARLAREIGAVKREVGVGAVDPAREARILSRLAAATGPATAPLDAAAVRRLWTAVLHECRRAAAGQESEQGGSG